ASACAASCCVCSCCDGAVRYRASFPTRRSSDLDEHRRVIVSAAAGPSLPMIGGCAPAWRPDGSMTYIRRGAIVQFPRTGRVQVRSEEHTSELQIPDHLVCRPLLANKKQDYDNTE